MSRIGSSALQVWTQVPVASRTVEVNTKTGFSLTAGSYTLHATSNQRGQMDPGDTFSTVTATISSVTLTRTNLAYTGNDSGQSTVSNTSLRLTLTNATTVTATRSGTTGNARVEYQIEETF